MNETVVWLINTLEPFVFVALPTVPYLLCQSVAAFNVFIYLGVCLFLVASRGCSVSAVCFALVSSVYVEPSIVSIVGRNSSK